MQPQIASKIQNLTYLALRSAKWQPCAVAHTQACSVYGNIPSGSVVPFVLVQFHTTMQTNGTTNVNEIIPTERCCLSIKVHRSNCAKHLANFSKTKTSESSMFSHSFKYCCFSFSSSTGGTLHFLQQAEYRHTCQCVEVPVRQCDFTEVPVRRTGPYRHTLSTAY